jgi:hypothetical protein
MMTFVRPEHRTAIRLAVAAALATGIVAAACSNKSTAPTSEFGTYGLVTVNGQSLPYTIPGTIGGTVVIQSASLVLAASNSGNPKYTATITGTAGGQPHTLLTDAGNYAATGSTLTFTSTAHAGIAFVGSLNGSTLTVTLPGLAFGVSGSLALVLQKQ